MKILLLEDELMLQSAITEYLEGLGHIVKISILMSLLTNFGVLSGIMNPWTMLPYVQRSAG
jgi:hypothetical protein